MKTYKTWEVIKMLTENPKLRFENQRGYVIKGWDDNKLCCLGSATVQSAMYLNDKWTLVQQPVSFMEAIKAYAEGKAIICTLNSRTNIYKPRGKHGYLIDHCGGGLTAAEILEGTWYIEREE